jgi:hypothetical protein
MMSSVLFPEYVIVNPPFSWLKSYGIVLGAFPRPYYLGVFLLTNKGHFDLAKVPRTP